ncbi:MAG: 4-(cytidine 5'-diphospho)-2-C-methyl-D-erythritol kinase, partial [Bacteroidales bacterium]
YFYLKLSSSMIDFPGAKINIGLRITSRRADGYHDIQTIFYPVGLYDILEFAVQSSMTGNDNLAVSGINPCEPRENMVIKALIELRERHDIPFLDIHLHKVIPPGAGLGGGSSDAAVLLKMLNKHFNLQLSNDELKTAALSTGSDSPFFIDNVPAYAEGRGEILTPISPLPAGFHLLIVYPGIHVNTREAYMNCKPVKREPLLPVYYMEDIRMWKDIIINDFEEPVFRKYPQIREIKELLYNSGALYSSMSGSGSAVYGIFSGIPRIPYPALKYVIYSGPL